MLVLDEAAERMADGDLSRSFEVDGVEEIMHLGDSITRMQQNLHSMIKQVASSSEHLAASSEELTASADQSAQALQAWAQGIVGREGAAQMLKVPESWLLPIPDGMTEYEHWELATGSKGAPYAEVDGDGKLIVPPPDFDCVCIMPA